MYTTGDIIQLFKANGRNTISRQTIINWAREFAPYLSVTANPPGGHRRFNQEDLNVLALVSMMKEMGNTYEDIHISLQSGQRGKLVDPVENTAITPVTRQLMALEARIVDLEEQLEDVSHERDLLKMEKATGDALLQRAEARLLEEQSRAERLLAEAQAEIARLNREIGRLTKD